MRLLNNSGGGNGATFEIREWGNRHIEHMYTLFVWGTFGGATVTVEISPDETNWFPVSGVSITDKVALNLEFRARFVRAVVTGGTAPSIQALLN